MKSYSVSNKNCITLLPEFVVSLYVLVISVYLSFIVIGIEDESVQEEEGENVIDEYDNISIIDSIYDVCFIHSIYS